MFINLAKQLWVFLWVARNLPHKKLQNIKYIRLKLGIVITPLVGLIILAHMLL